MLHLERLKTAIEAMGQLTARRRQQREDDTAQALRWLAEAPVPAELRARLASLASAADDWAGALPVGDAPLDARLTVAVEPPRDTVVVAADGSQVYPDPHAAVLYYLLQIGALVFRYDGSRPMPYSCESLHFQDDELYDARGFLISEERLGMQRLVREMQYLAELVAMECRLVPAGRLFALTDGPLLWPHIERNRADFLALEAYLEALSTLRQAGGLPVGYIARPGERPLVELLWAAQLAPPDIPARLPDNPLRLLTDRELMASFLLPGERSAWFSRPSATNQRQAGQGHEVWFCYLNVGTRHAPTIARVEVPKWAATDEAAMTTLHAVLLHQAGVLNGYPYVLARAHEEALVTTTDKVALDAEIQRHILGQGILLRPSVKAQQKAYLGRR